MFLSLNLIYFVNFQIRSTIMKQIWVFVGSADEILCKTGVGRVTFLQSKSIRVALCHTAGVLRDD